jgi:geranylgeranylglycerol-phosphate geranylgeranyltransferase
METAAKLSSAMFILSIILSFLPPLLLDEYFLDVKYIIPIAFTDLIFLSVSRNLWRGFEKGLIRKYRKQTLVAMSLGLVGFMGGAL